MALEGCVDVLIIGAGPAGLMCANALTMAGTNVRIIDKRPIKIAAGQADGISPRTIEVLQSYGLAERLIKEGNHIHMATFYNPGKNGGIECTESMPILYGPRARYPFVIALQQAAIEANFLDSLKGRGIKIERPRAPSAIVISEDIDELSSLSSHLVKVTVEHLDAINEEGKTEIIHAKFVIGADGAHSWVRKTLGIGMEGEQTDYIWGVVDTVPETNFPDIRKLSGIHSEHGSCLIIPREGNKNRFYIQLSDSKLANSSTGRLDKSQINPRKLLSVVRKILHPYELAEPKEIEWWTIYTIGQRVASKYSIKDRVFIAGDACHTHSPQAGQGMNASINDVHNLAWKLVQVLRGWCSPSLLKTYEFERRAFAQDLIKFDKEFAALSSEKPKTEKNESGVSQEEFTRVVQTRGGLISGVGIQYSQSAIVDPKHQECARRLVVGQRMPPRVFVRAADIHPVNIHDMLPADARFKVLFFVGSLTSIRIAELDSFAEELSKPSSCLRKYSAKGDIQTMLDVITIVSGKKGDVNHLLVPAFFRPHWSKVLLDDTDATGRQGGRAYEDFGIDPAHITLVIIRPDGYVGMIVPSTAIADLDNYFGSFMVVKIPSV